MYEVLLDTDNNPATGCDVHVDRLGVPDQVIHDVDQAVIATIDRSVNPPVVNTLAREVCSGGSLGAPIFIPSTPWHVGQNDGTEFGGSEPADVVEGFVALADLGDPATVRAVFVAECTSRTTDFVASPNGDPTGPPILFDIVPRMPAPVLTRMGMGVAVLLLMTVAVWAVRNGRLGHRAVLVALILAGVIGVAWARTIHMDGLVEDWAGIPPVATNGSGASNNVFLPDRTSEDIVACFLTADHLNRYFRFDLNDIILPR